MMGTALVDNPLGLIVVAVLVAYFYVCGISEERNLTPPSPRRTRSTRAGRRCWSRLARALAGTPLLGTRTRSGAVPGGAGVAGLHNPPAAGQSW
jgi:hypothetical protein